MRISTMDTSVAQNPSPFERVRMCLHFSSHVSYFFTTVSRPFIIMKQLRLPVILVRNGIWRTKAIQIVDLRDDSLL